MYKKINMTLRLLLIVIIATAFYSCSDESAPLTSITTEKATDNNLARQAESTAHSLTIVNNSKYDFAIFVIGAQTNRNLYDNIEINHKNTPILLVPSRQQVTYYDYKNVSNTEYSVDKWNVIDHSIREGHLGAFSCDVMSSLYGLLTNPHDPSSDRFPVWNYMMGGVVDQTGEYLRPLTGNTSGAALDRLGNVDQGYNSMIKYGITTATEESRAALDVPGHTEVLASVRWRQESTGIRNAGAVKIIIENISVR